MPTGDHGKHMVLKEKYISSRSNKIDVVILFTAGRGNFVFNIWLCYLPFLLAWETGFQDQDTQTDVLLYTCESNPMVQRINFNLFGKALLKQ
jgi:hypothetical protein